MDNEPYSPRDDELPASHSTMEALGTHPFGAVFGLLGGGLTGAVVGLAAGPVGLLAGAVGGAMLGVALATGSELAPRIDVGTHDRYWRENFTSRPYVPPGAYYADYGPAYRHGARAGLSGGQGHDWAEVEKDLAVQWDDEHRAGSRLSWQQALPAVRDAWERAQDSLARTGM